jgi:hypothetical protein
MRVDLDSFLDAERAAADVPAGPAFAAWRLRVLSREAFAALGDSPSRLSRAQLAYLAWLDLLAPTTHNTVPQRLQIDADEGSLTIWIDRERVLPESDPVGRQALVSVGCGIANVELAARSHGWETDVEVVSVPAERLRPHVAGEPRHERVAILRFRPGAAPTSDAWVHAMLARKVVRAEFDERVKLDADIPAKLFDVVARHPGLELHLVTDAASLLFLGKFQELADTTVVNRDRFALELGGWLLEDDAADAVGMRGREFGMSAEATHRMRQGLLRLAPLLPDEIAGFAKVGNVGMRSSSAVGVLTVDDDGTPQRIAAGRAYEEMALLLGQRGFSTAMHAGITEVDAPNFALRGRLRTRRRPDVLFRIGRVLRTEDGARPHSSRPHLRDVLLEDARTV